MSFDSFGYEFEHVVQNYIKYRPSWPTELYDKILWYLDEESDGTRRRGVAVDVGCGSGQSTLPLAKRFRSVIGIDTSELQIKEARRISAGHENVAYRLGSAEELSTQFEANSVDLITVGIALHWFDQKKFFGECRRVLKDGGIVAAYASQPLFWDNKDANDIMFEFLIGTMGSYWPKKNYHVLNQYDGLFPILKLYFEDFVKDDSVKMKYTYSMDEMIGYIKSFPWYYDYKADHPEYPDELDLVLKKLMKVYGNTSTDRQVATGTTPVSVIMGRKTSNAY